MLKEKDYKIIRKLRNDSRQNLTQMSRETGIPVSTIYDRIKKYRDGIVRKNTVLLDFKKLGYELRVNMLLKVPVDQRDECLNYLKVAQNVNSLYRINNGYDFMVELLFKNMEAFKKFTERIEKFGINTVQEHFVLEDIKREGFLTTEQFSLAS